MDSADTNEKLATLSGTISHAVFQNNENGYTVLRLKDGGTLCGIYWDTEADLKDADFTAKGVWKSHKKYGNQFEFETLEITESGLFYFLTRIVKGLGKKLARTILKTYTESALEELLDNNPQTLLTVKGIKQKKLARITSSWERYRELRTISYILLPYGVTQAQLIRVYNHFVGSSFDLKEIKTNPYILTDVRGFGFKTADTIARNIGLALDSPYRIQSCIDYVMDRYFNEQGNSCVAEILLKELALEELDFTGENSIPKSISDSAYQEALSSLIDNARVVRVAPGMVSSNLLFSAENFILSEGAKRSHMESSSYRANLQLFIGQQEEAMGLVLADEQKEAIALANTGTRFLLIAGYAGTGKSTVCKAILDLVALAHHRESIICCALSGIAADRIRKLTGYESKTIQSLLTKKEELKIRSYQILLVDEASMVNSELLFRLLLKINHNCTVILVGDPAQLPPIGAGNPFHDLLKYRVAGAVELTRIYRQNQDQVLSLFANQIRQGQVPKDYLASYSDFAFTDISIPHYFALRQKLKAAEMTKTREQNAQRMLQEIKRLATAFKPQLEHLFNQKDLAAFITFLQVISPIKSGPLGTDYLNAFLQQLLNPDPLPEHRLDLGRLKLLLYDKVVHTVNQDMDCYAPGDFKRLNDPAPFKRRIFNGMVGIVFKADRKDELVWVYYPLDHVVVEYAFHEARDFLQLSYALTIHKTQGSEYQNVIIPITMSHFIMLNNKLLYTAVTRAKKYCHVLGETYAWQAACKRKDTMRRQTVIEVLKNTIQDSAE